MENDKNNRVRLFRLMDGVDVETVICQYMDLDYLIRLLETEEYIVKRKSCFQDKRESSLPIHSLFSIHAVGNGTDRIGQKEIEIEQKEAFEKASVFKDLNILPTACWTERIDDSILMWKNYTTKLGACIKSSIQNIVASFKKDDYDIWCGRISYEGFNASQSLMESLFVKDKQFSDEKEIRFYFVKKQEEGEKSCLQAIKIPTNPNVMIDEVILSPFIEKKARDRISISLREQYNVKTKLNN